MKNWNLRYIYFNKSVEALETLGKYGNKIIKGNSKFANDLTNQQIYGFFS